MAPLICRRCGYRNTERTDADLAQLIPGLEDAPVSAVIERVNFFAELRVSCSRVSIVYSEN